MPSPTVDVTTGAAITFDSGFFAEITNIDWGGITRPAIDVSHMGITAPAGSDIGNMLFIPGDLSDPGEITVDIHFNPDTQPPIDAAAETLTITWSSGAIWSASGFMTSFDISGALEDKMTATCTIKITGNITLTPAT